MERRTLIGGLMAAGALPLGARLGWRPGAAVAAAEFAPSLRVDGERINGQLMELAEFGKSPTGTQRMAYTEADRQGRAYIVRLMEQAGLEVRLDAAANLIGRRAGTDPDAPVLLFGSHIDSVPNGGNYDGDVGVLASIEVARVLQERGQRTRHPLEIVVFQNEEGGVVGSKLMAGRLKEEELDRMAVSGKTLRDGIAFLGGNPAALDSAVRRPGELLCYLELHIEQGGTLERLGRQIGVVEGIVGLRWFEVTVEGFANHAGTTPMDQRKDAMLAAARFTVEANRIARSLAGRHVVTVGGKIEAHPGATNVIPGRVVLTIDLRDLSVPVLDRLTGELAEAARTIGAESGTTFSLTPSGTSEPALMDDRLRAMIAAGAEGLGLSTHSLPSGAGHDAQEMARIAPTAMLFIPSIGGISHSPREYSRPEDVTHGADVLLRTVLAVDQAGLAG